MKEVLTEVKATLNYGDISVQKDFLSILILELHRLIL